MFGKANAFSRCAGFKDADADLREVIGEKNRGQLFTRMKQLAAQRLDFGRKHDLLQTDAVEERTLTD